MSLLQAYKMAIKSIMNNKVRSFLTMLGVIIGVGSVITAVAFAKGSTKSITDQLSELGTELITVNISMRNSNRDVNYTDLEEFTEQNAELLAAMAPQVTGSVTLKNSDVTWSSSLIGTTEDYSKINKKGISSGRFLIDIDNTYRQKIVVLGSTIVKELYKGQNPIGKNIKINGNVFKIVGVMEETASSEKGSNDDRIFIPITTAQRLLKSSRINSYQFMATSAEVSELAGTTIENYLFKTYKSTDAYRVTNMSEMLDTLDSMTGTMMTVLGGIAAISLLVGGIGIMNIMLVSVSERTREIGIRMAIGAKRRNILLQFLIEALMVTGIGGILGIILGNLATFLIGKFDVVPSVYSVEWMVLAFGISLLVGVVFGLFPANKASKLKPIDALRYE
ncbi:MAG: ABC transporter permease [Firmicutes bacterium HGW-Firmicutes-7]|nr:MAG: ABC transporter permease [Firmicutes bacterium HGW-Firmicutes-7]